MDGGPPQPSESNRQFTSAELGALAHLYRGEVFRSTTWRTRLDTTTNWSVVTLGVALSITFSSAEASPLPLVLVGILLAFFLLLESRRYRYFNVWRARARWLENHLYAPMLNDGDLHLEENWQQTLAKDYTNPKYHITFLTALGRRLRYNYIWLFTIQTAAYYGKITIHPEPMLAMSDLWDRAAIGPIPGAVVILTGLLYNGVWLAITLYCFRRDMARRRAIKTDIAMG